MLTRDETGVPGRGSYALLALGGAAFLTYGSLVPFDFDPITLTDAIARYRETLARPIVDSRTDFVTNILLAIPISYGIVGALATDRRNHFIRLLGAVSAVVACVLLALGVEFLQVFFPVRTDSASDVVAQTSGAVVGSVAWLAIGERITAWLRASLKERERSAVFQRVLLAYCVIWALTQVMPLDLTINPGELARKYRRGGILLRPFSYPYPSTFEMAWEFIGDVALNAPVGAAAMLLWTRGRSRRSSAMAIALGVTFVAGIELLQVVVNSRIADSTDVVVGSLGVLLGVAITARLTDLDVATRHRVPVPTYAWVALLAWLLVLMSYHWNPYDFTTDGQRVTAGMHQLLAVPFHSYYVGTPFHAFTEMLRKATLTLPLGVLLRLANPWLRGWVGVLVAGIFGAAILGSIELGQVFLPTRTPDNTDVIIGTGGVILAFVVTGLVLRAVPSGGLSTSG